MIERESGICEVISNVWNIFWNILWSVTCFCWNKAVLLFWATLSFIFLITGKEDDMIICLLAFMTLDYASGILKSIILKKLNSKVGYRGILKKVFILIIVVIAYRLDIILHLNKMNYNVRFATIGFYIANEGLSILENASLSGLPVPPKLKDVLEQYKEHKLKK